MLLADGSPLAGGGRNFDMVLIGRAAALRAPYADLRADAERFARRLVA